jgi:hypothetical protein
MPKNNMRFTPESFAIPRRALSMMPKKFGGRFRREGREKILNRWSNPPARVGRPTFVEQEIKQGQQFMF